MSERKTGDAEIQRIVRWIKYPSQEVTLIKETKNWNTADFLEALERLDVDLTDHPKEIRDQLRLLYRSLRSEREATEERAASEVLNTQRHIEISRRLDELKKPHWSIAWNFWMTAAILIFTVVLVITAILAFRH
jgi:hypothetical protein